MLKAVKFYQAVLMDVVKAGGWDAELALKMWCQWEFEALMEEAVMAGALGPRELH